MAKSTAVFETASVNIWKQNFSIKIVFPQNSKWNWNCLKKYFSLNHVQNGVSGRQVYRKLD